MLVIFLGVLVALLIALFSWWLAGRSLLPAQRAWKHQQQFIANASHELRTPLTLIRANAEVAQRSSIHESRRQELLQDILQECDHVGRLVEDMLLLSRLDAKKLTLVKERVDVPDLVSEVHQQFRSLAERQGIALVLDFCAEAVLGDRTRLRQVLTILVDNALKFTPTNGAVHLGSSLEKNEVVLFVRDNGVGIAQNHLRHVFDRFYQVNAGASTLTMSAGSGLGLSIAKGLVETQGGSIQIESTAGEGTCVTVRFRAV